MNNLCSSFVNDIISQHGISTVRGMTMTRGTPVIVVILMTLVLTPAAGAADYSGPEIQSVTWTPEDLSVGDTFTIRVEVIAENDTAWCNYNLLFENSNNNSDWLFDGNLDLVNATDTIMTFEENFTVEKGFISPMVLKITAGNITHGKNDQQEFEISHEGCVKKSSSSRDGAPGFEAMAAMIVVATVVFVRKRTM